MLEKELEQFDLSTQRHLAAIAPLLEYKPNSEKFLKMHKSEAKTRLILGGKRSGKTTFGVVEVCWAALGIHPYINYPKPPLKIRVCGVSLLAGIQGILLPMFKAWLGPFDNGPIVKKYWSEQRQLELRNGTVIDFKSYEEDLDKFEGVERHLVWMDEEPPREIYTSNFARTISKNINGKLLITCTPLHGLNWIYDDLYDNPQAVFPVCEWIHVSIFDNPHLHPDAIASIKADPVMKDELDSILYGLFVPKSGLIYKNFSDKNVIQPVYPAPSDWLICLGIDPHPRTTHGVIFCGLTRDNAWIVFDELLEQCTIKELVGKIRAKMPGGRWPPNMSIIDYSAHAPDAITGRSIAQEMLQCGLPTFPAFKDVEPGILKVQHLLEPSAGATPLLYITENCTQTLREFRHYVWDEWARAKDKYNPKEKPLKKDDHLLDALRYIVMANMVYRPPGFKWERKEPERVSSVTGYFRY